MVRCLECRAEIKVSREAELDDVIVCKRCGTRFVVVDLEPIEIDYEDDEEEEEVWDDDEDWEDDWGDDE